MPPRRKQQPPASFQPITTALAASSPLLQSLIRQKPKSQQHAEQKESPITPKDIYEAKVSLQIKEEKIQATERNFYRAVEVVHPSLSTVMPLHNPMDVIDLSISDDEDIVIMFPKRPQPIAYAIDLTTDTYEAPVRVKGNVLKSNVLDLAIHDDEHVSKKTKFGSGSGTLITASSFPHMSGGTRPPVTASSVFVFKGIASTTSKEQIPPTLPMHSSVVPVRAPAVVPVVAPAVVPVKATTVVPVKAPAIVQVKAPAIVPVKATAVVTVKAPAVIPVKAPAKVPVAVSGTAFIPLSSSSTISEARKIKSTVSEPSSISTATPPVVASTSGPQKLTVSKFPTDETMAASLSSPVESECPLQFWTKVVDYHLQGAQIQLKRLKSTPTDLKSNISELVNTTLKAERCQLQLMMYSELGSIIHRSPSSVFSM